MKVGLFFGSFNPIHIGHLAIAEYIYEYSDICELWFIVSPQNPFKRKSTLLDDQQRLEMVYRAIKDDTRFRVSDIEFKMPRPSYTIDTLTYLKEKHPENEFVMIMGSDNLESFSKWKNFESLENNFQRYIYPRHSTSEINIQGLKNTILVKAPRIEISSSFIRNAIKDGKSVRYFLPSEVFKYIDEMNFYK
jgi:nicotinate-nucleotide adenylyltransferase